VTQIADANTQRIPVRYWIWLFSAAVSLLGDITLTFGIGWAASHYGGRTAGLVMLAVAAPRATLLLVGGAIGDKYGPHRVMLLSCIAMATLTALLIPATMEYGEPVWLLFGVALLVGMIDAFFLPSFRALVRLMVPEALVPRAVASQQVIGVVFTISGGAVAGAIVGLSGLTGAALFDLLTFLVVIGVLIWTRPAKQPPPETGVPMLRSIGAGIKVAFSSSLARVLLLSMTAIAGMLMPADALLFPLFARDRGWDAQSAGLVVAARSVGVGVVALRILARGSFPRPGLVACGGLAVAGSGLAGLSFAHSLWMAVICSAITGCGVGLYTGHVLPLLMNSVAKEYQSRVQSVLVLGQNLSLIVMNPLLGFLIAVQGVSVVLVGIGLATTLVGVIAVSRPAMRNASFAPAGDGARPPDDGSSASAAAAATAPAAGPAGTAAVTPAESLVPGAHGRHRRDPHRRPSSRRSPRRDRQDSA
jgi:MFS family permease